MRRQAFSYLLIILIISTLMTSPVCSTEFFSIDTIEGTFKTHSITIKLLNRRPSVLAFHNQDPSSVFLITVRQLGTFIDANNNGRYDKGEAINIVDVDRIRWSLNYSIIEKENLKLLLIDLVSENITCWPGRPHNQDNQGPEHSQRNLTMRIRLLISSGKIDIDGFTLNGPGEVLANVSFLGGNRNAKSFLDIQHRIYRGTNRLQYSKRIGDKLHMEIFSGATKMNIYFSMRGEFDGKYLNISVDTSDVSTRLTLPEYEDYGEILFTFGLSIIAAGMAFSPVEINYTILSAIIITGASLLSLYTSKRKLREISRL
ncbi:MAG: hypothetical protein QW789_05710 [Nitrososphaerota archaeon]